MGQSNGVLLKEVAAIWRCPLIGFSACHVHECMLCVPTSIYGASPEFNTLFPSPINEAFPQHKNAQKIKHGNLCHHMLLSSQASEV